MCTYMLRHAPPSARTSIARSYLLMDFFASLTHGSSGGKGNMLVDRILLLIVASSSLSKPFPATAGRRAGGFGIIVSWCVSNGSCVHFLPLTFILPELLKDERNEIDVAGPTLPALKAMLDALSHPKSSWSDSKYGRLVH